MPLLNMQIARVDIGGVTFEVFADPKSAPDPNSRVMSALVMAIVGINQRLSEVELAIAYLAPGEALIPLLDESIRGALTSITQRAAAIRQAADAAREAASRETQPD